MAGSRENRRFLWERNARPTGGRRLIQSVKDGGGVAGGYDFCCLKGDGEIEVQIAGPAAGGTLLAKKFYSIQEIKNQIGA